MTWHHVPGTDYPSAQAALASIWASCSPNPASTLAATSNGKPIRAASSSQPSGPDTLSLRRSGTTSPRLTPNPLPEQSTPCWLAIHVSHFLRQANDAAQTTSGTYGPTSPGSPANSAQPSNGSSSKTSPGTSPSALKPCCENYGTWASRLRLAYSQRVKLARRMKGFGGSVWPTADTPSGGRKMPPGTTATGQTPDGRKVTVGLENAVKMWTTPQAHDVTMRGSGQVPTAKAGNACLARDAAMWGTPRASDAEKGGPNQSFGAGGTPLPAQAANWPTATTRDHKGSSPNSVTRKDGKSRLDMLDFAAEQGFSRPVPAITTHGPTLSQLRRIWRPLRASVMRSHKPATWRRLIKGRNKRRLNPLFVEWLMGWPPGHALCACSATEWCLWSQHMRSALLALPTAYGPWIWTPPKDAPEQAPTQMDLFG